MPSLACCFSRSPTNLRCRPINRSTQQALSSSPALGRVITVGTPPLPCKRCIHQSRRSRRGARAAQTAVMASQRAAGDTAPRVVIVGGGVIGSAIAYFLSLRGVAATIVERTEIACAASGKAGGFLALDWSDGRVTGPLSRRSFELHARLADELGQDTGYRRVQTLSVAASAGPQKAVKGGKSSIPSWLDTGRVTRARVMADEDTTAQVHPALFTRALVARAESKGATVRIGTVRGLETASDPDGITRVTGVQVDDSILPADVVVIAMGPWSSAAAKWVPGFPHVEGDKATSVVVRPAADIPAQMLFTEYRDEKGVPSAPEVYPRGDGTVYMCGGGSGPLPEDPASIQPQQPYVDSILSMARNISTHLGSAELDMAQAYFLPSTSDGAPVIGALPSCKGAYVATGHSCWGILNAPATGEAMAELILDGKSHTVDISALSPARFTKGRHKFM